ncbi:MAG: hypothetical protein ACM3TR_09865 [Caulobacteraceae bacterium]
MKGYLWRPNRENILIHRKIKDKKPNFAAHIYQHNKIIQGFAEAAHGGIELLELPVCEHCERVAANYHEPPGSAYCWSCGKVTITPITLREYLMVHLKIPAEEMELIEKEIYSQSEDTKKLIISN